MVFEPHPGSASLGFVPKVWKPRAYLEEVLLAKLGGPILLPEATHTQVTWSQSVSEGCCWPLEWAHPGPTQGRGT